MKNYIIRSFLVVGLASLGLVSCQKGNLLSNPNEASTQSTVPVSLIFNRIVNELYEGGGVLDGISGNQPEIPFSQIMRWNQYFVSNYSYYWGANAYNWSNTATMYSVLKYVNLMESQIPSQLGTTPNAYSALAKFFEAYLFIWYTQRVGDIPMSQAGSTANLTPAYDTQHDVYKNSLALLDTANTLMAAVVALHPTAAVTGDIYGLTNTQWQKVINTYKLRVLISLSKRAVDNADLNIPSQFATIVNNPSQYPIMTGISDNVQYTYNAAYNKYPINPNYTPYDFFESMSATFLDITTANQDPRTFIAATPAPDQITGGKQVGDFSAYVGADVNLSQSTLLTNSGNNHKGEGMYSFHNYLRYYVPTVSTVSSPTSAEPYIIIGYPEMCFNIAEAANRGWLSGVSDGQWYLKGINASMAVYGLADGVNIPIGDEYGNPLGTVSANVSQFLANPNVAWTGDGTTTGLNQILTQKYVAFWQNSGWEAFYNWRRTGVPTFQQGGSGIGTSNNMIPIRWQYPTDEQVNNTTHYSAAIASQYGGTDDITKPMWLIK
ncbi:MAG: SusD/RagB family nutrient-binding outer membrane lipoprotein [Puia sp.]|nr:SusD/RagB family nutrient-binding outer membrane lipoprotein [Puia sp.]